MRHLGSTCLLLSSLAALGCFEDLGPLPDLDDIGATESTAETTASDAETSESGSSESSESESSESESSESESSESESSESDSTEGGIEGVYEPCGPNDSCEGGGTCNTIEVGWFTYGVCVPLGCSNELGCPAPAPEFGNSAFCNGEGECVLGCDTNAECGLGLVCSVNQNCYYNVFWGPCSMPSNCPMNSICTGGPNAASCLPQCNQDSDCPPVMRPGVDEPVCMNNLCEIPCVSKMDCPYPMECVGNVCRYSGSMP